MILRPMFEMVPAQPVLLKITRLSRLQLRRPQQNRWNSDFKRGERGTEAAPSTKSRRWVEISDGLLLATNQKVRTRMSLKL
jgi:hypothetical protein